MPLLLPPREFPLVSGCRHVCSVAVLDPGDGRRPRAARTLLQNQIDFDEVAWGVLREPACADAAGLHLGKMHYRAVIVDGPPHVPPAAAAAVQTLRDADRLITCPAEGMDDASLLAAVDHLTPRDLWLSPPHPDIRCRHLEKAGRHYYLVWNEGAQIVQTELVLSVTGSRAWVDPLTGEERPFDGPAALWLGPGAMMVVAVETATFMPAPSA